MSTFLVQVFGKFIPHSIVIVERPGRLAESAARTVPGCRKRDDPTPKTAAQADRMPTCGCSRTFLTMASWLPLPAPPTC
jgi:hypothetical protein